MIYVNDLIENISEKELLEALDALPEWRKAQAMRFKHHRGRVESAFSYLLLCDALRERGIMTPPSFIYGKEGTDGKPSLAEHPGLYFNLSHCKCAVACAVADHPVGIDIEMLGRYTERLAAYTMNEEELAKIASAEDKDLTFTRLWTMKEAAMKLTGEGISTNVRDVLSASSANALASVRKKVHSDNNVHSSFLAPPAKPAGTASITDTSNIIYTTRACVKKGYVVTLAEYATDKER